MKEVYKSAFMRVALDGDLLRVVRSSEPFESVEHVRAEFGAIMAALDHLDLGSLRVLTDLREAPLRNDPEFEKAAKDFRELSKRAKKWAVLVRTAIGALQLNRLARGENRQDHVFDDEAEARAFLDR
jgi:hypothetical protein